MVLGSMNGEPTHVRYLNLARLMLLPLAVLSVVMLARDGFRIPMSTYFDQLLDAYDGALQAVAIFVFEPLIKAALSWAAWWLQIEIELFSHWKYVFVLWWLVFGAIARVIASSDASRATMAAWYAWGGLCALAGGVTAGIAPLSSLGALLCLSGLFFYVVGINLYFAGKEGLSITSAFLVVGWSLISSFAIGGFAATIFDPRGTGYGLKVLVTTIAGFAGLLLFSTAQNVSAKTATRRQFWHDFLRNREATGCLDVLTALGSAAIIVYLFRAPS